MEEQPFEPATREFLLEQGSCCGCGCLNCPYTPKNQLGATELASQE